MLFSCPEATAQLSLQRASAVGIPQARKQAHTQSSPAPVVPGTRIAHTSRKPLQSYASRCLLFPFYDLTLQNLALLLRNPLRLRFPGLESAFLISTYRVAGTVLGARDTDMKGPDVVL